MLSLSMQRVTERVLSLSQQAESEISELEDDEKLEFLLYMGMESLDSIERSARATRCWKSSRPSSPPVQRKFVLGQLKWGRQHQKRQALSIQTFKGSFAEVVAYDDFITYQGESGAKEAGKWVEGKQ